MTTSSLLMKGDETAKNHAKYGKSHENVGKGHGLTCQRSGKSTTRFGKERIRGLKNGGGATKRWARGLRKKPLVRGVGTGNGKKGGKGVCGAGLQGANTRIWRQLLPGFMVGSKI